MNDRALDLKLPADVLRAWTRAGESLAALCDTAEAVLPWLAAGIVGALLVWAFRR